MRGTVLIVLFLHSSIANDDIDCQDVCGEYTKKDSFMENVQKDCKAFDEDTKCPKSSLEKDKLQNNKNKETGRIVGGENVKEPLPWVITMALGQDKCGGSLINSRFVLSAAHCSCPPHNNKICSRKIGEVKNEPITIKDLEYAKNSVRIYIGATGQNPTSKAPWTFEQLQEGGDSLIHPLDNMYIHPLLSTSEEFKNTPDILLIRLEKAIPEFSSTLLPVCLPKPDHVDIPPCPDNSIDRLAKPTQERGSIGGRMLGGCGIIAGWGARYSREMLGRGQVCSTSPSLEFPSRAIACTPEVWLSEGIEVWECQKKNDPVPDDFSKACKKFIKEVNFQAATEASQAPWAYGDFKNIANIAPVQIWDVKKNKNYTCSTTDIMGTITEKFLLENPTLERDDFPGWCATKTRSDGKIKEMGICSKSCKSTKTGIQMSNINLLTTEECAYLAKNSHVVPEYEMCAGKKHLFPSNRTLYVKIKKKKDERKVDVKAFKKKRDKLEKISARPAKYKYLYQGITQVFNGVPSDYPYNWYLGGVDTCQGDSGGPLWRNIEIDGKLKAVQLGVVSRGEKCAEFNNAGVYTRVAKIYDWLKEIIDANKEDSTLCPKSKK